MHDENFFNYTFSIENCQFYYLGISIVGRIDPELNKKSSPVALLVLAVIRYNKTVMISKPMSIKIIDFKVPLIP